MCGTNIKQFFDSLRVAELDQTIFLTLIPHLICITGLILSVLRINDRCSGFMIGAPFTSYQCFVITILNYDSLRCSHIDYSTLTLFLPKNHVFWRQNSNNYIWCVTEIWVAITDTLVKIVPRIDSTKKEIFIRFLSKSHIYQKFTKKYGRL